MLTYLAYYDYLWGPLRLFKSHMLLLGIALTLSFIITWLLIPKLIKKLPKDTGRAFAVEGNLSTDKPTGGGVLLFAVSIFVMILTLAPSTKFYEMIACIIAAVYSGYADDKANWGEWKKGLVDLLIALIASVAMCQLNSTQIWLPMVKTTLTLSPLFYITMSVPILWLMINTTNCTDGVDGLAGTLSLFSLICLGGFLYIIVGHKDLASYLLIPHNPNGATWAILVFSVAGSIVAYLWYNAQPSLILMGDAGSRALGLTLGIAILATGNPFMLLVVAPIILLNGGGGLVKLLILRFCKRMNIPIEKSEAGSIIILLHRVRFPLHDHFRHNEKHKWSNAQVLMRFSLVHGMLLIILMGIILKVR